MTEYCNNPDCQKPFEKAERDDRGRFTSGGVGYCSRRCSDRSRARDYWQRRGKFLRAERKAAA